MFEKLTDRNSRKWLYMICLAVVPLLVFYGVIEEDAAPLWIALIGSVLAPVMALTHLSPPVEGDEIEEGS